MRQLLIALQFLTILPVQVKGEILDADYKGLLAYFPLAGACIGGMLAVLSLVLGFMPLLALAACLVVVYTVMTGALHLDGLADTCDGIFSGKPKDKILEIMRDSRIGAFGAIGICLTLILKVSFLASISPDLLWKMLIIVPVFSRWIQALACASCGYARNEGKANGFFKYATMKDVLIGGGFVLAVFIVLAGLKGALILLIAMVPVVLFIRFVNARIQGMTGDTVGATSEIAELSVLFFSLLFLM